MIVPPTNVRVLIATKPVDFRKGMDGLAALIAAELKLEPYSGVIYVFRSKRADRVKLLFWASETSLFQSRLAHAGYVATPAPAWPDSPTAEALRPNPNP